MSPTKNKEYPKLKEGIFKKTGSNKWDHGSIYENKIRMLSFLNLQQSKGIDISIAAENAEDAFQFDDLYVQYKKFNLQEEIHDIFVQIKHRSPGIKISFRDLLIRYSMFNYFSSFCSIRRRISQRDGSNRLENFDKNSRFFIFTNGELDLITTHEHGKLELKDSMSSAKLTFVKSESSGPFFLNNDCGYTRGKHFKIDKNEFKNFIISFKDYLVPIMGGEINFANSEDDEIEMRAVAEKSYKKMLNTFKDLKKQNLDLEVMIKLFAEKLFFSVLQYQDSDLDKIFYDYFKKKYKLEKANTINFIEDFSRTVKKIVRESKWVKKEDLNYFFKNIEFDRLKNSTLNVQRYYKDLLYRDIEFNDDLSTVEKFIDSKDSREKRVLHISTSSVFLSSLRIAKFLENHGVSGYLAFMQYSQLSKDIIKTLESFDVIELIVIECQGKKFNDEYVHVINILDKIITTEIYSEKKIILISPTTEYINGYLREKFKNSSKYKCFLYNPLFKNLTSNSKEQKILTTEVFFQNQSTSMPLYKVLLGKHYDSSKSVSIQLQRLNLCSETLENLLDKKVFLDRPSQISELAFAYTKLNILIDKENIIQIIHEESSKQAGSNIDDEKSKNSLFLIDGPNVKSLAKLIPKRTLYVEEITAVWRSFGNDNKQIILIRNEISEDEFKQFCHFKEKEKIYWIHLVKDNYQDGCLWKMIYDPIIFPRTIKKVPVKSILKRKIEERSDYFIIHGSPDIFCESLNIKDEEKKNFLKSSKLFIRNDMKKAQEKFIELMKNEPQKSIHRFEMSNNRIIWKESFDNEDRLTSENEKPFDLFDHDIVLIVVDDPGMGKSTLLTQLADNKLNDSFVIRINLNDCKKELEKRNKYSQENPDTFNNIFIKFLRKFGIKSSNSLTYDCLHYILSEKGKTRNLLILMDAYDEIPEMSRKSVVFLVNMFKEHQRGTGNRIVITSRHHPNVEEKLDQLFIIRIDGFDGKTRENFLRQWFESRNSLLKYREKVDQFNLRITKAAEYLNNIAEKIFEDASTVFTVPLQMRLLSEAYQDEVHQSIESKFSIEKVVVKVTAYGLYKRIIEAKINIYLDEILQFQRNENFIKDIMKENTKTALWRSAIIKIFGIDSKLIQDLGPTQNNKDDTDVPLRVGIALRKLRNNTYQFIHQTFAEYLATDYIMDRMSMNIPMSETLKFFLNPVLIQKDYESVRIFMEGIFKNTLIPLKSNQLLKNLIIEELSSITGSNNILMILYRTCEENNPNILNFLSSIIDFNNNTIQQYFLNGVKEDIGENVLTNDIGLKWAPLNYASEKGFKSIVEILLRHNANFNVECTKLKETPLHCASKNSHYSIVEILLKKGANIDAKDLFGQTPLHAAIDYPSIVKMLLKKQANIITIITENRHNEARLRAASTYGRHSIVEILLKNGAKIDTEDYNGDTPLHIASEKGHQLIVKILLKNGANLNAEDKFKQTALHCASKKGHHSIVEMLLEKQAVVDAKDNYGQTPLHLASRYGHKSIVEILLKHGANVNAKNENNLTPLFYASARGYRSIVVVLLNMLLAGQCSKYVMRIFEKKTFLCFGSWDDPSMTS